MSYLSYLNIQKLLFPANTLWFYCLGSENVPKLSAWLAHYFLGGMKICPGPKAKTARHLHSFGMNTKIWDMSYPNPTLSLQKWMSYIATLFNVHPWFNIDTRE